MNEEKTIGEPPTDPAANDGWLDYDDDEPESDNPWDDCGMTDEGLCMYAGSEWCEFDCPMNRSAATLLRSLAEEPARS